MNKEEKPDLISRYIDDLINSQYEYSPEEIHKCPVCNGELKIQTAKYKRGDTRMLGIMISCNTCKIRMAYD